MNLGLYAQLFRGGKAGGQTVTGLAGRIIRGKKPEDFATFTDDPDRKIVMFLGPDGLQKLLGKTGHQMLVTIGYEPEYLRHKVEQGNQFKLVVVEEGKIAKLATWDNTLELVNQVYPGARAMISRHLSALKSTHFAEIEKQSGFRFLEVEKAGKGDSRYMTYERLLQSAGSLSDVRAFLYFSVHLRELYRGDGYTDENGNRGPMEYIAPNMSLSDVGAHELINIDVILPPQPVAIRKGVKAMTMHDKLGFLDPDLARVRYLPNLELARAEGRKARKQHGLHSASTDVKNNQSRLAIIIDAETDFDEEGRLPVKGTRDDVWRLCQRLYRGTIEQVYTQLILTVDMHPPISVHSEAWWEDENGNSPDVTFPVQMELVDPKEKFSFLGHFVDGSHKRFRPRFEPEFTRDQYAPHLKVTGQGNIWIFRSHCHAGTDGTQLIPPLAELVEFMSVARDIQPVYMFKGMIAQVDWFGPFRPCMDVTNHPQGGLQTGYLDRIRGVNRTEVFGEAEDFCVKNGMRQVLEYFGKPQDRQVLESIGFMGDCTSPIFQDDPGSGRTANADFRREMEQKGVRIITHDLPFSKF